MPFMATIASHPVAGYDPRSELKVYAALKTLQDDWHIIHSVAWLGPRRNRVGDGEADFVLLHRTHVIIVIEVKGGDVDMRNGRWFSEDRHGRVNDIVIDGRGLTDINASLSRVLAHWRQTASLSAGELQKVVQALAPTVSVKRTLADVAHDADAGFLKLTQYQVRAFGMTRRTPRAVVFGGAGTGKNGVGVRKGAAAQRSGKLGPAHLLQRALGSSIGRRYLARWHQNGDVSFPLYGHCQVGWSFGTQGL